MKTTKPNWNMKKLQRMTNGNELRFDYPIQRASGQWDALQKSLLIHSILADMPIPPVAIVKAEVDGAEGEFVIDGKQRSTTVVDFLTGIKDAETGKYPVTAYPLHSETPTVTIDDKEIVLADKYFDELDADAQSDLLSASFSIQRMEDATDEEIEEIFSRWNNGTPLTKQQKARGKMGTANAVVIDKLLKHPFIQEKASFTALQRRRSDDEAVILQTMMLMADYDIPSNGFVADNILKYAQEMRDADITEVTKNVAQALEYANNSIEGTNPLLKKLHLPTLLMVAKKASDEKIDPEVFGAWVEDFNNAINGRTRDKALVKTNYKNYTGAGSVKRDKVIGRKNSMISHFNEFVDRYEPTIEEPKANTPKEVKEPKKGKNKDDEPKEVVVPQVETQDEPLDQESIGEVFAGLASAIKG